jgi:hypothetical protein
MLEGIAALFSVHLKNGFTGGKLLTIRQFSWKKVVEPKKCAYICDIFLKRATDHSVVLLKGYRNQLKNRNFLFIHIFIINNSKSIF